MATATLPYTSTQHPSRLFANEPKTAVGPLVVATDGTSRSDSALRAAKAIASVTGQKVLVLAVHMPLPVMGPEVQLAARPNMDAGSRAGLQCQVVEQLERAGVSDPWPLKVTTGYPATMIANFARNIDASLIVMGLGGHGVLDRIFGDEMVLQVLRIGTVPVLAVADGFQDLPARALAAVDFSGSSKRALELGGPLVRRAGTLTLAHVIAAETDPLDWIAMDPPHVGAIGRKLDRCVADIDFADGVSSDRRVLAGDPAKELLQLATKIQADLIITGSHGHNFMSRLLLGSVSTQLLRKAGCSILIAPPLDAPEFVEELPEERARFEKYEWAERLEEFTRRNLWRRARVEVFDPEIGAQVAENDVRFMGASFDPRSARVHLMFGSREGGAGQHVTHNIDGVTAVQMLRDRAGGDTFLRIGHSRGQTLLALGASPGSTASDAQPEYP